MGAGAAGAAGAGAGEVGCVQALLTHLDPDAVQSESFMQKAPGAPVLCGNEQALFWHVDPAVVQSEFWVQKLPGVPLLCGCAQALLWHTVYGESVQSASLLQKSPSLAKTRDGVSNKNAKIISGGIIIFLFLDIIEVTFGLILIGN